MSLNASDLFGVANGSVPKPVLIKADEESEAQARTRHEKSLHDWQRADGKAQKVIVSALGVQPMQLIMRFDTAAEMWAKLTDVYEQKSDTQVYMLQQRFFSATMDSNESIVAHIANLEDIAQQLRDQGENVSSTMLISKILMTLPSRFGHFHSAWESTATASRTIGNLTARLMVEESRLSSPNTPTHSESSAMAVNTHQRKQFPKNKNTQINKANPIGKCYKCGERGHYKRDCPKRSGNGNRMNHVSSSDLCEAFSSVVGVSNTNPTCNAHKWFLDTGATDHMTHRRDWFESFSSTQPKPIRVGNGNVIYACGIGNICVKVYDEA